MIRGLPGVNLFLLEGLNPLPEKVLINHRDMVLRKLSVNCYKRVIKEKPILVASQG
jgi:hypothetical protein